MLFDIAEMIYSNMAMDNNDNPNPVNEEDAHNDDLIGEIVDIIDYYDRVAEFTITTK